MPSAHSNLALGRGSIPSSWPAPDFPFEATVPFCSCENRWNNNPFGGLSVQSNQSRNTGIDTYTKDEQDKLDTFTLRQLFDEKEISYECIALKFVMRAVKELKKMPSDELDYLALNEPDIFEVFERRGGVHPRATASGATGTASGATGTASAAEEVPVCSSGAGSSRSSVSTSTGSSGGSTSRSS